jgi:hypothetical protein
MSNDLFSTILLGLGLLSPVFAVATLIIVDIELCAARRKAKKDA